MIDNKKNRKQFNFSHAGKLSERQFSYVLDQKENIDRILKGKRYTKIVSVDFLHKEESKEELNDVEDLGREDIFANEYKQKYFQKKKQQQSKYLNKNKKRCGFLKNPNNDPKNINYQAIPLNNIINKLNRHDLYYYHELHHVDLENSLVNNDVFINGPQINCTRYRPNLEFIYPKLVYSPSFLLMSGRNDKEKLSEKISKKKEFFQKNQKKEQNNLKLKKLRDVEGKIKNLYVKPEYYNEKNNQYVEIKNSLQKKKNSLQKSQSQDYFLGNKPKTICLVNMQKQMERSELPVHNNVKIRNNIYLNYNNSNINSNMSKTFTNIIFTNNSFLNKGNNSSDTKIYINITPTKKLFSKIYNQFYSNNDSSTLKNADNIASTNNNSKLIIDKYQTFNNINNNNSSNFNVQNHSKKQKNNNENNIENNNEKNNENNNENDNKDINNFDNINNNIHKTIHTSSSETIILQSQNIEKQINNIKAIDFDKMLSREYLNKRYIAQEPLHPQVDPNYNLISPKCVMKVVYAKKKYFNKNKNHKTIEGIGEDITFEPDKIFYKYNNHTQSKSFYFDKMSGRESGNELPPYMVKQFNRNSCDIFTDKSLKLNSFSKGRLKDQISSFNEKKSFNSKLNYNLSKYKNNNKIDQIIKKINTARTTKNKNKNILKKLTKNNIKNSLYLALNLKDRPKGELPEYYKMNLDKLEYDPTAFKSQIDGITLKSVKNSTRIQKLFSPRETKLFLGRFGEKEKENNENKLFD